MGNNKQRQVKLIAVDMDGTLLGKDAKVSEENIRALSAARERGVHVAIASGRAPFEVDKIFTPPKGFNLHLLCLNGAFLRIYGQKDAVTYLPPEEFAQCVRMASAAGIRYFFYTTDKMFTVDPDRRSAQHVDDEYALSLAGKTTKFVAESSDADVLLGLREKAVAMGLSVHSSWIRNFEVNAPGVDKGRALEALAHELGILRENTMAIGDQENDLAMLKWAGIPVAMGNASDEVKQVAAYITETHDKDGVAKAVMRFLGEE